MALRPRVAAAAMGGKVFRERRKREGNGTFCTGKESFSYGPSPAGKRVRRLRFFLPRSPSFRGCRWQGAHRARDAARATAKGGTPPVDFLPPAGIRFPRSPETGSLAEVKGREPTRTIPLALLGVPCALCAPLYRAGRAF